MNGAMPERTLPAAKSECPHGLCRVLYYWRENPPKLLDILVEFLLRLAFVNQTLNQTRHNALHALRGGAAERRSGGAAK